MRRALLLLAASFTLAGCGGDGGEAVPTRAGTTETTATDECTGDDGGYTVEYPTGWHQERCTYFDPEPFEVPEGTEFLDASVLVSREPVSLDVLTGDDRTREVLDLEETEIAGRDAVRLEAETTGEGLLDRGVRFYLVGVEADGDTVILSTYDVGDLDFERNKQVVDEMAETLELSP